MDIQSIIDQVTASTNETIFGVWFMIAVALVFFMQAGFAMVETGFTRAKNAGNIIMKNLMDFCIGTVMFIFIGFGLLLGEDAAGLIGKPGLDIFTAYDAFQWDQFVFNLVFCATTATIVSGAMAERTKFLSYCIYSGVISALIYPIEAHWIWGGGWLAQMGFHDLSGSCAIHMVGGVCALIGAKIVGPRIGKFHKTKDGEIKVNAIPGHNLTIGALGCFILWFGWYGFNPAAASSVGQLDSIFLTTTIAPAVATVTCMIFTWLKYGKPDVSMCLNASLAGLVGITAGCDVLDALGSFIVGVVSGLLVCFGVWLLDYKLHIDDPVGAVAVHMMNGIWGTIAVGLFATKTSPGYAIQLESGGIKGEGLFYGGGVEQLGIQLLGFVSVASFAAVAITITFLIIKHTIGLRASEQEEIIGLDVTEHGLISSYADFAPSMSDASVYGYTKDDAKSVEKARMYLALVQCFITRNSELVNPMEIFNDILRQIKVLLSPITPPNYELESAAALYMASEGLKVPKGAIRHRNPETPPPRKRTNPRSKADTPENAPKKRRRTRKKPETAASEQNTTQES